MLNKCMYPQLQWRHDPRHLWSHQFPNDQSLLSHWQASYSFFYSSCVCLVMCSYLAVLNSSFAWLLSFSVGFRNVRTRWVPLSRCVFLIPMLSLTSTRTSLLVSQQYLCRIRETWEKSSFLTGCSKLKVTYILGL